MPREVRGSRDVAGDAAVLRTQRDHQTIVALLGTPAEADDPGAILELLSSLAQVLPDHFADEEGPDGLFDLLRRIRPDVDPQLKFLEDQHRRMMQALELLLDRVRAGAWEPGRIQREYTAFQRALQRHERAESLLIADVYYVDEGGSG